MATARTAGGPSPPAPGFQSFPPAPSRPVPPVYCHRRKLAKLGSARSGLKGVVLWRRLFKFLGRLPLFFSLIRWMTPYGMRNTFPEPAWQTGWLALNQDVIAFNFHACFYVTVLREANVPELTPNFCRMDKLFYENVSPYLRFEQANTLALTGPPVTSGFTGIGL